MSLKQRSSSTNVVSWTIGDTSWSPIGAAQGGRVLLRGKSQQPQCSFVPETLCLKRSKSWQCFSQDILRTVRRVSSGFFIRAQCLSKATSGLVS